MAKSSGTPSSKRQMKNKYVAFAKEDPQEADDHIKNDLSSSRAKANARVSQRWSRSGG
jgi:hypothetical protein